MDLRLLNAVPTDEERRAVDATLEALDDGDPGLPGRVVVGGHRARSRRHLLLPALHALRDTRGWISEGGLGYACEQLTIPPAEAYGVATFYSLLGTEERPGRVTHLCDDIVCADNADSGKGVVPSPCLGACYAAPATLEDVAGSPLESATPPPPVPQDIEGLRLLRRVGKAATLADYRDQDGFQALERVRDMGPEAVIAEMEASNLRGRGGAAFPVAAKWKAVAEADGPLKHVIANGDESEPGTFKDRILMEADPFAVVEGLLIAAVATGATRAWIYVRAEYPTAVERLRRAVEATEEAGLADGVEIEVRVGAGAYVCGEETALFASIEGHRGEPHQKPPFPTTHGLFGQPTAINNVETLAAAVEVMLHGGEEFASVGTVESSGPKLFCVSGAIAEPGVFEVPYGTTLGDLLDIAGGPTADVGAVLMGGAAGVFVGEDRLDLPLSFEGAAAAGATLGSGAVVVFPEGTDFGPVVRRIAAFFRDESCGKCVPCRIGTVRQEESLIRLGAGSPIGSREQELALLADLDAVMTDASICGLGRTAASAVRSALALGLPGVVA